MQRFNSTEKKTKEGGPDRNGNVYYTHWHEKEFSVPGFVQQITSPGKTIQNPWGNLSLPGIYNCSLGGRGAFNIEWEAITYYTHQKNAPKLLCDRVLLFPPHPCIPSSFPRMSNCAAGNFPAQKTASLRISAEDLEQLHVRWRRRW